MVLLIFARHALRPDEKEGVAGLALVLRLQKRTGEPEPALRRRAVQFSKNCRSLRGQRGGVVPVKTAGPDFRQGDEAVFRELLRGQQLAELAEICLNIAQLDF